LAGFTTGGNGLYKASKWGAPSGAPFPCPGFTVSQKL
jgi:hypothetical protein